MLRDGTRSLPLSGATSDWRFTVGVVSGGHFLSHFYILAYPPLFPMLKAEYALSNVELGILISVISLATLLQMPVGELVDRFGAKRVFVYGLSVTSLGIILSGFATGYPSLLAFALLSGVGQSAFHPSDYALISAATKKRYEGKSFSLHTFGGYIGLAAAPLVVGTIAIVYGWRAGLVSTGLFGLLYAAFAGVTLDPVYHDQSNDGVDADGTSFYDAFRGLLRPSILGLFVFFIVFTMAGKGLQTFTPILVVDRLTLSETVSNTTLSAFYVGGSVGILVGGIVADRFSPHRIIVVTSTVAALTMWLTIRDVSGIAATSTIAGFTTVGFFSGIVFPSRDRLVNLVSSAGSTGKSFGFVFSGVSIGGVLAPVLLGVVTDAVNVLVTFRLIAVCYLGAAVIALVIGVRK